MAGTVSVRAPPRSSPRAKTWARPTRTVAEMPALATTPATVRSQSSPVMGNDRQVYHDERQTSAYTIVRGAARTDDSNQVVQKGEFLVVYKLRCSHRRSL